MYWVKSMAGRIRIGIVAWMLAAFLPCQATANDKAAEADAFVRTPLQVQVLRIRIAAEVSFDDAIESLKLRANQHNLKLVGSSPLYKEIQALTGKPARRMEIFSFCDGLVAQQMIAADPQIIAFMPCRIAVLEDEQGGRWLVTMMMDELTIQHMPAVLRPKAQRIMDALKDAMSAASRGDL